MSLQWCAEAAVMYILFLSFSDNSLAAVQDEKESLKATISLFLILSVEVEEDYDQKLSFTF